jgi:hypothetical protein
MCSIVSLAISLGRRAAAKPDEQQRPVAQAEERLRDRLDRGAQPVEHQSGLLVERPAVRTFDAGEGGRHHGGRGRRRVAGEQVHVSDRRVPQAQRVEREIAARLGGEKRRDRLGRRRQSGAAVNRAPVRETGDGRAVGAARIFRTRCAPVLRRRLGSVVKAGHRCGQIDDRFEVEPVPDIVWRGAGRQWLGKFLRRSPVLCLLLGRQEEGAGR